MWMSGVHPASGGRKRGERKNRLSALRCAVSDISKERRRRRRKEGRKLAKMSTTEKDKESAVLGTMRRRRRRVDGVMSLSDRWVDEIEESLLERHSSSLLSRKQELAEEPTSLRQNRSFFSPSDSSLTVGAPTDRGGIEKLNSTYFCMHPQRYRQEEKRMCTYRGVLCTHLSAAVGDGGEVKIILSLLDPIMCRQIHTYNACM